MKYLGFIRHSEEYRETVPPQARLEARGSFVEKSRDGASRAHVEVTPRSEKVRF
jgi:hypothetical protein